MSNPLVSKLRRQVKPAERPPEPPRVPFPREGAGWVGGPDAPRDGVVIRHFPEPKAASAEPDPFAGSAREPEISEAVKAGNEIAVQLHARRSAS